MRWVIAASRWLGIPVCAGAASLAMMFIVPAAVVVVGVYGLFGSRVGWHTLVDDSLLFFVTCRLSLSTSTSGSRDSISLLIQSLRCLAQACVSPHLRLSLRLSACC